MGWFFTKQSKTKRWGGPGRVAYSAAHTNKLFTLFDLKWMEAPGMWWPHLNGGAICVLVFILVRLIDQLTQQGICGSAASRVKTLKSCKPFSKLYKILLAIIMWLFVRMLLHTNLDTASLLRFSSNELFVSVATKHGPRPLNCTWRVL